MTVRRQIRANHAQDGIALLISIFILLLISVVAIALIVASGTESALAGNYRSSTGVYYAALAGLEEARSRLSPKNSSYFGTTSANFSPWPGTPLPLGTPVYLINPLGSEPVAPWDPTSTYPDTQYNQEFASSSLTLPNPSPSTLSVWNTAPLNTLSFPGPLYKWVRINAVSAKSLNVPVAPSYTTPPNDSTTPVFYDGSQLNISGTGAQVLELTALAVLPNGSQKILQYLVAPTTINLPTFPAALTLAGPTGGTAVTFSAPTSNPSYYVSGVDISVPALPSCTPGPPVDAIAVYHTLAKGLVINGGNGGTGIPIGYQNSYTGLNPAPDVQVDLLTNYQTPSQLNALAQSIIQIADDVVPPGTAATQTAHLTSLGMSPSKLLTVVANGDLDISNWSSNGYGLLLVTGTFTYDPDTTWNGIVLVIGQGKIVNLQNGQYKQINGAVLVAKTLHDDGTPIPDSAGLGTAKVEFLPIMQGNGIRYSSCWIKAATPAGNYRTLSFHEISQ